jgi:peroxiredoxin
VSSGRVGSGLGSAALALFVMCTMGTGCAGGGRGGADDASQVGAAAVDFTARDVEGQTFRLSDHLGKQVILLDFWATYCPPCVAEFPHVKKLWVEHQKDGFLPVAVSMDGPETMSDVPSFARRNGLEFPVVLDEDSRIATLYNPRKSAPFTMLIDRSGRIVKAREGFNPGDELLLRKEVLAALQPPATAAPAPPTP